MRLPLFIAQKTRRAVRAAGPACPECGLPHEGWCLPDAVQGRDFDWSEPPSPLARLRSALLPAGGRR
jgi:hypothetical protein